MKEKSLVNVFLNKCAKFCKGTLIIYYDFSEQIEYWKCPIGSDFKYFELDSEKAYFTYKPKGLKTNEVFDYKNLQLVS